MKASGLKDVSTCTAAMSRWACATLDYLRGFYLARLRLVKASGQKNKINSRSTFFVLLFDSKTQDFKEF